MKSILIVSNSIEYADFDIRKDVDTVSFCEMNPMAVAPVIKTRGSEPITCDIVEAMEFCFKESYPSGIYIGYFNDVDNVYKLMDELDEHPSVPCVLQPKLITDDGDLMVSEEVYNELMTKILPRVKLLVINHLETELIAGFECFDASVLKRAMKKIYNLSGCSVLIKPSPICSEFSMFDGRHYFEIGASELNLKNLEFTETKFSLGTACACALGSGSNMYDSVCAGIEVYVEGSNLSKSNVVAESKMVAVSSKEEQPAPERQTELKQVVEEDVSEAISTSLVSPVKSLRDRARSLEEKYSFVSGNNNSVELKVDDHKRGVVQDLMQAANEKEQANKEKELEMQKSEKDALSELHNLRNKLGSM